MAPDPSQGGALAPVEGALSRYLHDMDELHAEHMPDVVLHEYSPFYDSSDLGPADWARVAADIKENYLHFDGFVILTGTDTMAYFATALSFMLENLGKPGKNSEHSRLCQISCRPRTLHSNRCMAGISSCLDGQSDPFVRTIQ